MTAPHNYSAENSAEFFCWQSHYVTMHAAMMTFKASVDSWSCYVFMCHCQLSQADVHALMSSQVMHTRPYANVFILWTRWCIYYCHIWHICWICHESRSVARLVETRHLHTSLRQKWPGDLIPWSWHMTTFTSQRQVWHLCLRSCSMTLPITWQKMICLKECITSLLAAITVQYYLSYVICWQLLMHKKWLCSVC